MFPDVDQVGLGHGRPEDVVGPSLPRIPVDDEPRERIEEREGEPEELRDVPDGRLREGHRTSEGADLEAHDELPDRRADDGLEEGRVEEQEDAPEDAVHPGSPDVLDIQEGPEGREHPGEVDEVREDPLDPMDLERAIVANEVEAAHHERIPRFLSPVSLLKHPSSSSGGV